MHRRLRPEEYGGRIHNTITGIASNVAQSRNAAGVHYRTDALHGLLLGEAVGISILRDQYTTYNEWFRGFTFTEFDGSTVTI